MSKPWKPGKKTVELQAEVRPSRIRRDPLQSPRADDAGRKAYWRTAEWDRRFAVLGITLFALAIFVLTLAFSAIQNQFGGSTPANSEQFGSCDGGPNCVIDGETVRVAGETVKIAGIQTPRIEVPRCPEEQRRGLKAVDGLTRLLNSGKVTLGDTVRGAGGELRRKVQVDGQDVGAAMIGAGLAREDDGTRRGWCS